MNNYVSEGDVIEAVAPTGGVVSGTPYLVNSIVGIATTDAAGGATYNLAIVGVFDVPKAAGSGLDWAQGELIYFDDGAGDFTTVGPTGNIVVGIAAADAIEAATTGRVRLDGVVR